MNANADAPHLLKDVIDVNSNDPVFEALFFTHYENCPIEHENVNAVQFCKTFVATKSMTILLSVFRAMLC